MPDPSPTNSPHNCIYRYTDAVTVNRNKRVWTTLVNRSEYFSPSLVSFERRRRRHMRTVNQPTRSALNLHRTTKREVKPPVCAVDKWFSKATWSFSALKALWGEVFVSQTWQITCWVMRQTLCIPLRVCLWNSSRVLISANGAQMQRHLGWYYVTLGTDTLGGSFVV